MQGRLVASYNGRVQCFPRYNWEAEFERGGDVGFDCIEWLYDVNDAEANPLSHGQGVREILRVAARTGVAVSAVCAHCFVENPIVCEPNTIHPTAKLTLAWLIGKAGELGSVPLVIPLEENRYLRDQASQEMLLKVLEVALPLAEAAGVELDVESTMVPADLAKMLGRLPHSLLKVNYDSGNSAGMGHVIREEFASYGPRIGRVHIKDKQFAGPNVPLGTGAADFPALARCIRNIGYSGDCTLEVARCAAGEELEYARHNRRFIVENVLEPGAVHDQSV